MNDTEFYVNSNVDALLKTIYLRVWETEKYCKSWLGGKPVGAP